MPRRSALSLVPGGVAVFLLLAGCVVGEGVGTKLGLGAECSGRNDRCRSGMCFTLDSGSSLCVGPCSKSDPCQDGFVCERTIALGQVCLPIGLGGRCEEDDQCPAGHRCDGDVGRCYIPVTRDLCSPCTSPRQCPDGTCHAVESTGESYCTVSCAGGACPAGFRCEAVAGAAASQCVPDNALRTCSAGRVLCSPCEGHSECGLYSDLCVRNLASGETFCGKSCSRDSECPAGFHCLDLSGDGRGPLQCVPNAATCEGYCTAFDEATVRQQCGLGRSCDAASSRCTPATDGRACAACENDDDCSGTPGSRCLSNNCAECANKGEKFCATSCTAAGGGADPSRCEPGFDCVTWEGVSASFQCVPSSGTCRAGAGRLGDDCSGRGSAACTSGVCLGFGSRSLCSALCANDSECGDARFRCCALNDGRTEFDCTAAPGAAGGVCAPRGGGFGADCSPGQPPCFAGACLDLGTVRLCTSTCAADGVCPDGFTCRSAQKPAAEGGFEAVDVCFPDGGGDVGADCSFGPAACRSGYCIKKEKSGNVCSRSCAEDADCPGEYRCRSAVTVDGRQAQVCVPRQL